MTLPSVDLPYNMQHEAATLPSDRPMNTLPRTALLCTIHPDSDASKNV